MNHAPTVSGEERGLILFPFEVLHALMELFVGEVEEGAGFTELFLDGLVPDMFGFDVGGQAFGQQIDLIADPFDEHAVMADPLIDLIKAAINSVESLGNPFKSPVVPIESLFDPTKPLIKILNKFLIHTASAAR